MENFYNKMKFKVYGERVLKNYTPILRNFEIHKDFNKDFLIKLKIDAYTRPDELSYKLYESEEFEWTFYVVNDNIKNAFDWYKPYDLMTAQIKKNYKGYFVDIDLTDLNSIPSNTLLTADKIRDNNTNALSTITHIDFYYGYIIFEDKDASDDAKNITSKDFTLLNSTTGDILSFTSQETKKPEYLANVLTISAFGSVEQNDMGYDFDSRYYEIIKEFNDPREIKKAKNKTFNIFELEHFLNDKKSVINVVEPSVITEFANSWFSRIY